jgi:hypothetical protein
VIIGNFNFVDIALPQYKAQAELIVDADAVLAFAISC